MTYEGDLIEHYRGVRMRMRAATMPRPIPAPARSILPAVGTLVEVTDHKPMPEPEPEVIEEWRAEVMRILQRHGFTLAELRSRQRDKVIVACRREVAMYLARERGWSFPQIGRWLRRDHTSILYLVRGKGSRKSGGVSPAINTSH